MISAVFLRALFCLRHWSVSPDIFNAVNSLKGKAFKFCKQIIQFAVANLIANNDSPISPTPSVQNQLHTFLLFHKAINKGETGGMKN